MSIASTNGLSPLILAQRPVLYAQNGLAPIPQPIRNNKGLSRRTTHRVIVTQFNGRENAQRKKWKKSKMSLGVAGTLVVLEVN